MGTKRVQVTLTDKNGCTVEIDGVVDYSILHLRIDGFKGTITLSGGPNCPKGKLVFRRTKGKEGARGLIVSFDKKDISKVSKITWQGDHKVIKVLNGHKINKTLCNIIRSVPFAEIRSSPKRTGEKRG